jgi:hypothetical protein
MRTGSIVHPPPLPGAWSIWSASDDGPGAHFAVPADDKARATGIKYAVVRITNRHQEARPVVELLRTDPPLPKD